MTENLNQDPANQTPADGPNGDEAKLAVQGAFDALEGRSMDNVMHAEPGSDITSDQLAAMRYSDPEAAAARTEAARLAPKDIDDRKTAN